MGAVQQTIMHRPNVLHDRTVLAILRTYGINNLASIKTYGDDTARNAVMEWFREALFGMCANPVS